MATGPGEPYKQPKYGGFQVPRFLGGPHVNKEPDSPSAEGAEGAEGEQKAPGMKLGAKFTEGTMTRTFERGVKVLYEGEPYRLGIEERAAAREEAAKKQASEKPFKPSTGPHKSRARGDYTGTIGGKYQHMLDVEPHKTMKGEVQFQPPNIKTNPPKVGSYGQPWTTMSEKKGAKGVVGEYTYSSDPYDALRRKTLDEAMAAVPEKPFKPSNYSKKGGGTTAPGVLFNKANVWQAGPSQESKPEAPAAEAASGKPFMPSAYPKSGYNRTLQRFPEYVADPLELKQKKALEQRKAEKEAMGSAKPFVPPNVPRTQATVSILRKNL